MKSLCVFCGSSSGVRPAYSEAAAAIGTAIAQSGRRLIYGGGHVGLMGVVADAALAAGGEVIGVIPEALRAREVDHASLTELHVVANMHQRKALMAELSDGFIALPGGIGTLEELFEIWTWGQLGMHDKPYGLLNVEGYFDDLLKFLDHAATERFLRHEHRNMLIMATDSQQLLTDMQNHPAYPQPRWITRAET